ncbi:MAG: hypothetical protein V4646_09530 [Pseudomonadota bacterium]
MFLFLKVVCLAIYALAIAGLAGPAGLLPDGFAHTIRNIAAVMLIVHALELLLMFKHVRLYRGLLATSVLLTLLFGLLHWKPLADQHASMQKGN